MQDFHFFRLVEFDKCVRDFQIPCRWAPDAGLGYGEPLFNFYGQASYAVGEFFHKIGFSKIDSLKILFALSLLGSALTMFLLAKKIWNNNLSAMVSSMVYLYAPYRAVDVWVRGVLPEATSFILFPLLILKLEEFFENKKIKNLLWLSLFLALLILNHNLSVFLFVPFLVGWGAYRIYYSKDRTDLILKLFGAVLFALLISSFYLLPVIFESKFIDLASTTRGYFDYRGHFASLNQLLLSRFWGYGASVFGPDDGLSLSVGQIQWILPVVALILSFYKGDRKVRKNLLILLGIGWLSLFLTHNRSTFLWGYLKQMAFIQFPWRFLSIAVFSFSLASGAIVTLLRAKIILVVSFLIIITVITNMSFFKEDIWYLVDDKDMTSGLRWEEQTRASIGDYWPKFGASLPSFTAPSNPEGGELVSKLSDKAVYKIDTEKEEVEIPINYFPGWIASVDGKVQETYPNAKGLIATTVSKSEHQVILKFRDTTIRVIGNFLTLISLLTFGCYLYYAYKK